MPHTAILRTIPISMSAKLAIKNLKKVKKKSAKDFIKQGTENIVGTALIKETAQFIDF